MMDKTSLSIKIRDNEIYILNQTLLPHKKEWLHAKSPEHMIGFIKALKTRGAPLIGVSAVLSLAKFALDGATESEFQIAAKALKEARPTAVNLMLGIDRLLDYDSYSPAQIEKTAEAIFNEDVALCEKMAKNGAPLIEDGDHILTHCNTGGLATAGMGTALGVIQEAHKQGKKIHVYVDETRPLLQGGRLTTFELEEYKIPYTLICDNMAASLMRAGKIQKAFVGADRIALNGDFANKIGTYNVAILCHYHKIPFYMVAPYTTIDPECETGNDIPIEQRSPVEVQGAVGAFGELLWAPKESPVYNPAFDVTPSELVSAWIFDQGVFHLKEVQDKKLKQLVEKD